MKKDFVDKLVNIKMKEKKHERKNTKYHTIFY